MIHLLLSLIMDLKMTRIEQDHCRVLKKMGSKTVRDTK